MKLYSTEEIAAAARVSVRLVQKLGSEMVSAGIAQKVGRSLVFSDCQSAVEYIRNRPDGRYKTKGEKE